MRRHIFSAIAVVFLTLVSACSDGGSSDSESPSAVAPTISVQPRDIAVEVGGAANFSVTADGTPPITYEWKKNGVSINGAVGSSYSTGPVAAEDNGAVFTVTVGNTAGVTTSRGAILSVSTQNDSAPTIVNQPANQSVMVGQTATFSVTVSGASPLSYQWRRNGADVPGATNASFTTSALTLADNGSTYSVHVENLVGSVDSSSASLTVTATGQSDLLSTLVNFAETGARNWNHGGHVVDLTRFTEAQGFWDYTDSTFEPWLYDRPEVWRMLAEMTGDNRWNVQAQQDLDYYESRLGNDGLFLNKGDDAKYSYVHTWSTNPEKGRAAYQATLAAVPNQPDLAGPSLWTERQMWFALDAAVKYHTISNDPAALVRAQAIVDQWDTVAAGRGAPLVTYTKHEGGGPGGTQPTDLVSSPWMSALYFQSARLYVSKVPAAANQVYRQANAYFNWLNTPSNRGFYPGSDINPSVAGLVFPGYLAGGTRIGDAGPSIAHWEHALDVAGYLAFTIKAQQALGLSTSAAEERLSQMKETARQAFLDAIRTTAYLPRYRLNPPRKIGWWVRGMYEIQQNHN